MEQLYRDNLKLIVLNFINKKPCYGYEIISFVSQRFSVQSNNVYPLLKKMSQDKLVDYYLTESAEGAPRKYYKLNPTGQAYYNNLLSSFYQLYSYLVEDDDE